MSFAIYHMSHCLVTFGISSYCHLLRKKVLVSQFIIVLGIQKKCKNQPIQDKTKKKYGLFTTFLDSIQVLLLRSYGSLLQLLQASETPNNTARWTYRQPSWLYLS